MPRQALPSDTPGRRHAFRPQFLARGGLHSPKVKAITPAMMYQAELNSQMLILHMM